MISEELKINNTLTELDLSGKEENKERIKIQRRKRKEKGIKMICIYETNRQGYWSRRSEDGM